MAVVSSLLIAALLILFICTFAPFVTSVFNSEHDARLASYAESGLRLYFTGFIFAGINIVGSAILSAVESVKYAFAASIMRGFIAISIFAFALSAAFGMTGVWLAFPAAEFVTMFIIVKGLRKTILIVIDKFFSKIFFMLEIKHTSCFYNAIILSETQKTTDGGKKYVLFSM